MWYKNKVVPSVVNAERELVVNISHPGPEYWLSLGRLIGYPKGKEKKGFSTEILRLLKMLCFAILIMPQRRKQEIVSLV